MAGFQMSTEGLSLYTEDGMEPQPVLLAKLRPDKDGVFNVDFIIANNSDYPARQADVWIDVCNDCSFSKEPDGFDRPRGLRNQTRHMMISLLNPRASTEKYTLSVKPLKSFPAFEIQMRYSCDICKYPAGQKATILELPVTTP